jgi:hypothetical protein
MVTVKQAAKNEGIMECLGFSVSDARFAGVAVLACAVSSRLGSKSADVNVDECLRIQELSANR